LGTGERVVNLRKLARDRECTVRIPGVCCGDPATTVLAHFRLAGVSGIGMKSPDLVGAWACRECHDAIDRRGHMDLDRDHVRLAHAEGMARTINTLIREGVITA